MSGDRVDEVHLEEVMGVPVASVVAVQVLQRLDGDVTSAAEVGRIMDLDPALSTRAVFLAISSYYGLRERVARSERAVPVLGLTVVRALVAGAAFGLFERAGADQTDVFWTHAVGTAAAASVIAERVGADPEHAFSLKLLHDMGAILHARRDPEVWRAMDEDASGRDVLAWERERFGCDHADLGARALAVARLPEAVVAAVAATTIASPPPARSPLCWSPPSPWSSGSAMVGRRSRAGRSSRRCAPSASPSGSPTICVFGWRTASRPSGTSSHSDPEIGRSGFKYRG